MNKKNQENKSEVVIDDLASLEKKIENIAKTGSKSIQVLADFDRTLTTAFVDGKKVASIISVLRDGDYISRDYAKKANEIFNKYHPLEIDLNLSDDERKAAMESWWQEHFKLLIDSGLNINHINQVVQAGRVRVREGIEDFFALLKQEDVPLVIVSSSGLGVESIRFILEHEGLMIDNIEIVSNRFIWDNQGNAIGVEKPIVHLANKDEVVLETEISLKLDNRKNVVLLGDNIDDKKMIRDFEYDELITIGFLNESVEKNIDRYKKEFDAVITNDGTMKYINNLLTNLI
jgi:cytosolic 5'-nucleotidase 3